MTGRSASFHMKCQKCGTDIPEGKIYCEKCGSAIQMVPDYNPVDDISIDTDTPDAAARYGSNFENGY